MADDKPKAMTKSAVLQALATGSGLKKQEVSAVLDALVMLVVNQLGKKGPGIFTIPGLLRLKRKVKPATKAHMGVNPFTKQPQMFQAKPERKQVKASAVKSLADAIK